jgi:spore coat protein U-like protein
MSRNAIDSRVRGGGGGRPRRPGRLTAVVALFGIVLGHDAIAMDCVVSTTGVAFGTYDPLSPSPSDAVGNLTVRCVHTAGGAARIGYTVSLSPGSSGSYAQRTLRSGSSVLFYNLFDGADRTRVWGDGTAGTGLASGVVLLVNPGHFETNEAVHPIYGRVPALQEAGVGTYSDTILVTLSF